MDSRRRVTLFVAAVVLHVGSINCIGAPRIQPMTDPQVLKKGGKLRATCSATAGVPPFSFKWMRGGQNVQEDDTVSTEDYEEFSILVIQKLESDHAGNYTCVVTNKAGSDRSTFGLVVNAPPAWVAEPKSAVALLGDRLQIKCQAEGYPTPMVRWTKASGLTIEGLRNGTLDIQNVTKSDEGEYTCKASNSLREELEKRITIKVIVPARFEKKFEVETVRRGESATLQCHAIGDKPLQVTWSQEKKPLQFVPYTRYERFETSTKDGVSSELVIPTTERSDAALYTCLAKNEYGSDERNIKLLVVEVPAQPLDLRILEVWSRKVSVMWAEPYSGNSPITNYVVHYWRDKEGPHRLHEEAVSSSQTAAVIGELHPGTSYALTITAENKVGQGAPSDALHFVTAEEEPGGPPTDVWASAKGPTSIAVSWKPPPRDLWHGQLKGYYVGYRSADSSQPYSFKTVDRVTNGSQEVTLVGLDKSSRYSVIVKAHNAAGTGLPSEPLVVRTLDGDVPQPPALSLMSTSDSSIKLKWSHAKATTAPITGYTLHYKKGEGPWHHIPVVASDETTYTLTDLDGGSTYHVYLTASNQYGRGAGSEAIVINTREQDTSRRWVFYKDPSLVVPAASLLIALLVVITVITVCIKKTRTHKNFEKSALASEKRHSSTGPGGDCQRYIDVQEKRASRGDAVSVSSYATIQSRRSLSGTYKMEELRGSEGTPAKGHHTSERKDRRRNSSLRKSTASTHVYDSAA